ncbi:Oidioi.mRNA.OKI2018_I69.chr2.g6897.t1.cds [Oikopleura dioica]|uniref:Oidioi.mRNA.OKI2018_I69.chr2.g6897.t1.cds n=1 Tax=Oikopleura dioica TaxID=34765 RepID=A0ABN7TAL3_OIKDI|nr:Oidioi.mRNA.OKI2018_I69.chr2.g6897.t1.cds [Oikopleura dioica]
MVEEIKPSAIQVIKPLTITEDDEEKQNKSVANLPVSVISVTGAFRTGKSFLLNYLLRYLTALENEQSEDEWLGDFDQELEGFKWRRGADPETSGIMAWNKVFVIEPIPGQKQAVLLLDTQGAFDLDSDVKDITLIFALSTMLSSLQIYNVRGNLQTDNLQHLQLFTEFGRQAIAQEVSDSEPFQNLLFLVRDWQLDDSEGFDGGSQLLEKLMKITPKMNDEKRELREHVKSCFKSIRAFLMSHPGDAVRKGEFKGETSKLHPDFVSNMKTLVPELLNLPDTKFDTAGNPLTCAEVCDYFKKYTAIFQNEEMPETVTIMEATAEVNHHMAVQKAKASFKQEIEDIIPKQLGYLQANAFDEKSKEVMTNALEQKYGPKFRSDLEAELISDIEQKRKLNDERRAAKLVQTPLIIIVALFVCWFAIFILEMLWLSPIAAFVNIVSTLLIGGILVWLADQSNLIPGGFPVQQIIDLIAELLRDNILKPMAGVAMNGIRQANPDVARIIQQVAAPKDKED